MKIDPRLQRIVTARTGLPRPTGIALSMPPRSGA